MFQNLSSALRYIIWHGHFPPSEPDECDHQAAIAFQPAMIIPCGRRLVTAAIALGKNIFVVRCMMRIPPRLGVRSAKSTPFQLLTATKPIGPASSTRQQSCWSPGGLSSEHRTHKFLWPARSCHTFSPKVSGFFARLSNDGTRGSPSRDKTFFTPP
jgi:hypothetical protein